MSPRVTKQMARRGARLPAACAGGHDRQRLARVDRECAVASTNLPREARYVAKAIAGSDPALGRKQSPGPRARRRLPSREAVAKIDPGPGASIGRGRPPWAGG